MTRDLAALLATRTVRAAGQAGAVAAVAVAVVAGAVAGSWAGAIAALCLGTVALAGFKAALVVLVRQRHLARDLRRVRQAISDNSRNGRTTAPGVDDVRQQLDTMRKRLDSLDGQVAYDAGLRADVERALAQLSVINQELAHRRD